jgi:ComF family protein
MTKLHRYRRRVSPLEAASKWLLELALPIQCLDCGQEGEWICPECREHLTKSLAIICVVCAKAGTDGICPACRQRTGLDGVVCLLSYSQPPVQQLVKAVKFSGQLDALRFFDEYFGRRIKDRLPSGELTLVAVPLSSQRRRERGFNQAGVLAERFARRFEFDLWEGLVRIRHTEAQAELKRAARLKNLRRAFAVTPGAKAPERVALVDDVITTGVTLEAAAKTLRRAGTKEVWAVTIAHG